MGDYSKIAGSIHHARMIGMQRKLSDLLIKRHMTSKCKGNKNVASDVRVQARYNADKVDDEMDELRKEIKEHL